MTDKDRSYSTSGQFLITDVWAERKVPQSYWVELVAPGDTQHKVWQPLEQSNEDYRFQFLAGSPRIHGGRLFVATSFKPQ